LTDASLGNQDEPLSGFLYLHFFCRLNVIEFCDKTLSVSHEASIEVSCHVCQTELCNGAHDKEDFIEMLNAMLQRPVED
jgi:hypothetical protein